MDLVGEIGRMRDRACQGGFGKNEIDPGAQIRVVLAGHEQRPLGGVPDDFEAERADLDAGEVGDGRQRNGEGQVGVRLGRRGRDLRGLGLVEVEGGGRQHEVPLGPQEGEQCAVIFEGHPAVVPDRTRPGASVAAEGAGGGLVGRSRGSRGGPRVGEGLLGVGASRGGKRHWSIRMSATTVTK